MRGVLFVQLLFVFALFSCGNENRTINTINEYKKVSSLIVLDSFDAIDTVKVKCYLDKYTPGSEAKGGGTQYFDYEITLPDSSQLLVSNKVQVNAEYLGKDAIMVAVVEKAQIHSDTSCYQNTGKFWQVVDILDIEIE